jgi:Ca-activated chloride channel homolog
MKTRYLLRIAALLIVAVAALSTTTPVAADGFIIIDPPIPGPSPDPEPWLAIRYHHVYVTIEDQIAMTEIDQAFQNDKGVPVEGTYIFPLPQGAVIDDFTMWVDDEIIESKILPADEAREIYEGYVRRQQDPALLEYIGRDAVRARIFPIPAGGERRIRIKYTQVLPLEDQLRYYRYPLDTERFSATPVEQVSIQVSVKTQDDLRAIYSPSHQNDLVITRQGDRQATASYEARDVKPDRDFELYIGTAESGIGLSLLTYEPDGEDGTFMVLLSPNLDNDNGRIPRDVILVLDTSGSMEGEKLVQARAGLTYILKHLNPEDRFNVIAFSSQTRAFASHPVEIGRTEEAIRWMQTQDALGGTNIYLALSEAMTQTDPERSTSVVFLTDGLPTEGLVEDDQILNGLATIAPGSIRIFPFGLGYDVNVVLLDQLAQQYRGRSTYVEPEERVDEKISTLYTRMQSPVLTDITLDFADVPVYDLYPNPLPDLFAETQLVVVGRYRQDPLTRSTSTELTLSGDVRGERVILRYPVTFSTKTDPEFLPRLWAARKIGYLLTQIRLHGEQPEWVNAVTQLSLQHGIITPYTSFLIEEPQKTLSSEGRAQATDIFKEELSAMPQAPSGEQAVEDAKLRQGLGGAEAPVSGNGTGSNVSSGTTGSSTDPTIKHAGARTFICELDRCTDTQYVPDTMRLEVIVFSSPKYEQILSEHPSWAIYFSLAKETILVADEDTAYRLTLTESENDVEKDGASDIATPTPTMNPPDTDQPSPPTPNPSTPPSLKQPLWNLCAAPFLLLVPIASIALKKSFG